MSQISLLETRRDHVMLGHEVNTKRAAMCRMMMEGALSDEARFGWHNLAVTAEQRANYFLLQYDVVCYDLARILPYPPDEEVNAYGTLISKQKPQ